MTEKREAGNWEDRKNYSKNCEKIQFVNFKLALDKRESELVE